MLAKNTASVDDRMPIWLWMSSMRGARSHLDSPAPVWSPKNLAPASFTPRFQASRNAASSRIVVVLLVVVGVVFVVVVVDGAAAVHAVHGVLVGAARRVDEQTGQVAGLAWAQ